MKKKRKRKENENNCHHTHLPACLTLPPPLPHLPTCPSWVGHDWWWWVTHTTATCTPPTCILPAHCHTTTTPYLPVHSHYHLPTTTPLLMIPTLPPIPYYSCTHTPPRWEVEPAWRYTGVENFTHTTCLPPSLPFLPMPSLLPAIAAPNCKHVPSTTPSHVCLPVIQVSGQFLIFWKEGMVAILSSVEQVTWAEPGVVNRWVGACLKALEEGRTGGEEMVRRGRRRCCSGVNDMAFCAIILPHPSTFPFLWCLLYSTILLCHCVFF